MPSLLFLALALAPASQDGVAGRYTVSIPEIEAPYAEVAARIRVEEGRLSAGFGGAFDWATSIAGRRHS